MSNKIKNIAVVSLSTVGSRVFGLLRDILMFAALGASLWNSAFILAFTLPNLFRRLLGEGALTSALVPVMSDVMDRDGREGAFSFLNQVLVRLLIVLLVIITAGIAVLHILADSGILSEKWKLGAQLSVILLPYMLFICLAAIVSAALNLLGRFAVPAITPVLLNLAMIGALLASQFLEADAAQAVYWLCGGVMLGGVLQLAAPVLDLAKQGWKPYLRIGKSSAMTSFWALFLPGLLGAGILQVNILVSRLLAFSLEESAVSVLYLASRLMELPLGVFTIAVATVFFPLMAKACAADDSDSFCNSFLQGMSLVVAISVPAGIGLIVLCAPILNLLFQWGAFEATDVVATMPLIIIYGMGLPFYSVATFATRGLHSLKDMRTPVHVAGLCLLVNAVLGLILMQFFGASGLAGANVIAAIVQAMLLWFALSKARGAIVFKDLSSSLLKIAVAGILMGIVCLLGLWTMEQFELTEKLHALLAVGLLIPVGVLVYFGLLFAFKFEELHGLKALMRKVLP